MKYAAFSTLLAGLALAGVLVLFFLRLDAEPSPVRPPSSARDDGSVKIAALEQRIRALEQEVKTLSSYRPPTGDRDPAETEQPAEPDEPAEPRAEPDRTERRRSRQAVQLDELAAQGKIGKLSAEHMTKVEQTLDASRKQLTAALSELRNNPANAGLERERMMELMRTELTTIRQQFEQELAAFLPAADAQVVAEALMTNRTGRDRGTGRRPRGGGGAGGR